MKIEAWTHARSLLILGHGIEIGDAHRISDGVYVTPEIPNLDDISLEMSSTLIERAAITSMHEIASFSLKIYSEKGGQALANKGWNSLWHFHLLSLASKAPCMILYSACTSRGATAYAVANRNLIINPLPASARLTQNEVEWATEYEPNFSKLVREASFASAMRYFGNAHYLFDLEHRIMLLWAGIEGLLKVEAEHNHRIALYSAIMLDGSDDQKQERFRSVRQAYSLRSRVVHGTKPKPEKLKVGYHEATELLASLLARCVELGRVPERDELDAAAFASSLA